MAKQAKNRPSLKCRIAGLLAVMGVVDKPHLHRQGLLCPMSFSAKNFRKDYVPFARQIDAFISLPGVFVANTVQAPISRCECLKHFCR